MFGALGKTNGFPPTREALLPRSAGMSVSCLEDSGVSLRPGFRAGVSRLCSHPGKPSGGACVI